MVMLWYDPFPFDPMVWLMGQHPMVKIEDTQKSVGHGWAKFGPKLGQKAKRPLKVGVC